MGYIDKGLKWSSHFYSGSSTFVVPEIRNRIGDARRRSECSGLVAIECSCGMRPRPEVLDRKESGCATWRKRKADVKVN